MARLHHLAGYLLVAVAVNCLNSTPLFAKATAPADNATYEDNTKHRGSGRSTSQSFFLESEIVNRASDLHDLDNEFTFAHRGSGRIEADANEFTEIAYRGSGRISENEIV